MDSMVGSVTFLFLVVVTPGAFHRCERRASARDPAPAPAALSEASVLHISLMRLNPLAASACPAVTDDRLWVVGRATYDDRHL